VSWRLYRVVCALLGVGIACGLGLTVEGNRWPGIPLLIRSMGGLVAVVRY
jgi:hypothetical protein